MFFFGKYICIGKIEMMKIWCYRVTEYFGMGFLVGIVRDFCWGFLVYAMGSNFEVNQRIYK